MISLASLFDNLVAWGDFIRLIILAYRGLVDALWGPILDLLPIQSPRWLHDYLTLCGLSGVAVLWSLHQSAKELSFDQIGSTFGAIRRIFFDFSVASSAMNSFSQKAVDETVLEFPVSDELRKLVARLARLELPKIWIMYNLIWIVALIVLVVVAPYGLPLLMRARDRTDIARARTLFDMRRTELADATVQPLERSSLSQIFESQVASFLTFEAINQIYYRTVIRHQAWYYAAVFVLFFMLVFVNYVLGRIGMS